MFLYTEHPKINVYILTALVHIHICNYTYLNTHIPVCELPKQIHDFLIINDLRIKHIIYVKGSSDKSYKCVDI